MTYRFLNEDFVIREADGVLVRLHPESPYFAEYTEWLAQGNKPSVKDETNLLSASVRCKRDLLLNESDWTQLSDARVADKPAWEAYRQELRDITKQPGFPHNCLWPKEPRPTSKSPS